MPLRESAKKSYVYPVLIRCCMQIGILALEYCDAQLAAGSPSKLCVAEDEHNIIHRLFLIWINPVLLHGYSNILGQEDLPPLCADMHAARTRRLMLKAWRKRAIPDTKWSLPLALMACLKPQFYHAVLPRLFLIVFRYSQPTLIASSIRFVEQDSTATSSDDGFWLVISALVIYLGLALSTVIYQSRINRLKLMTRSALTGLIHDKTMKSPSIAYEDGEATTLMSTDANALDGIAEMIHEIWAQVIEVVAGIVLLSNQVGWIWPLPLFLICGKHT
ncbi:hypothetical protein MY4824_001487 [Beauveria thailandica]